MQVEFRTEGFFAVGQDKATVPPGPHLAVCTSNISVPPAPNGVQRGHHG